MRNHMRRKHMLSILLFSAVVMLVSSAPATADTSSLLGKPAPDFSLTMLDGKVAKLSAQKGKVVVICFWVSDPQNNYVRDFLPYIQGFSANQDLARKGLVVWAITEDQHTVAALRNFLTEKKYTFDVPYDRTSAVFRSYLVPGYPMTVVIGSDGIIKNVISGFTPTDTAHRIGAAVERAFAEAGKLDATAWIGKPAPAFLLTAANGAAIHLDGRGGTGPDYDEKYNRKVIVITFWADRNSSANLLRHMQELAGEGVTVMTVATGGQTPGDVRKFLLDNRYTFEVSFDTPFASWEDSLGKAMATFVIGRRGVVTSVIAGAGAVSIKQIDDAVAPLLYEPLDVDGRFLIGKPAPDFSLTTLDGKTVKLSDQRGKVVLLDFWASWCYPCHVSLPHTQELNTNRDLASKGLGVWAVTQPDDKQSLADAQSLVASHKYTFAVPCDREGSVSQAYGITGIPRWVIVGRDGLFKTWGSSFVRVASGLQLQTKPMDDAIASALAESSSAVSSNVQPAPPPAPPRPASPAPSSPPPPSAPASPANPVSSSPLAPPAPSRPADPAPSSPPAPQPADPLASVWQSVPYAGQIFHFKLNSDAIDVYGSQQELLGTLQAKGKNGAIDMYQGLVRLAPVTQCPGGRV